MSGGEDIRINAYRVLESNEEVGGVWIVPEDPWGDEIEGTALLIPLDLLERMIPFLHGILCNQLNSKHTPKQ